MDVRFAHPCTCVVSGPTGSGKTEFVAKLNENISDMMVLVPEKIVWCYGEWQRRLEKIRDVESIEGLAPKDTFDWREKGVVIIDDLMNETNRSVTDLFTKGSHHRNISVMYIAQNLFNKGKEYRTISLNSHYIVFKNPRDSSQIIRLAKQAYTSRPKIAQQAFADATSDPYGYLLFDFKQSTPEKFRLRSKIFPDENRVVYVPI